MAYDQRSSYVIGVVLLMCGCGSTVLGVMAIFMCTSHFKWLAAPIWSGVIAALTGVLGIVSGKRKQTPGKCLISSFLVFNILSTVASLICWVVAILGILDDKATTEGAVHASRAVFAVSVMLGVTEMLLAGCAVVIGCAGVYCYKEKIETSARSHDIPVSEADSSDFHTLQPGDHVIEAANGDVIIVSEGQVIHPGTRQIKIVSKEGRSIPPPYGIGDIDAADILQPEAVTTQLPPYAMEELVASLPGSQRTTGRIDPTPPDVVTTKQPPSDFVEPSHPLPCSSEEAITPSNDIAASV